MDKTRYADRGNLLATSHRVYAEEMRIADHLREIRDGRLYEADGYSSFQQFCEREMGMPFDVATNMIRSLIGFESSKN